MIYEPREDSYLLEKSVIKYSKGKSVLDMGTGSAIQALAAKKHGAKSVLAVDINPEAVKNTKALGIDSIKSNLFEKVKGKFDLIVCNPPYLPEDSREDKESRVITSGGPRGDEFLCKFLSKAKNHLEKYGFIFIVLSSLTPRDRINQILKKSKMQKEIISSEKMSLESLEVWLIKKV